MSNTPDRIRSTVYHVCRRNKYYLYRSQLKLSSTKESGQALTLKKAVMATSISETLLSLAHWRSVMHVFSSLLAIKTWLESSRHSIPISTCFSGSGLSAEYKSAQSHHTWQWRWLYPGSGVSLRLRIIFDLWMFRSGWFA